MRAREALRRTRPLALAAGVAFCGGFAAIAAYLRVLERGEPINERTQALVAVFGGAGALAALVAMALCAILAPRLGRGGLAAGSLVLAAPGFVGALALCFSIQLNAGEIAAFFDHPDAHGVRYLAYRTFVAAAYIVVFGPSYLWPWPAPTIVAAIAGAAFLHGRRFSSER
ncbi:MAG: hypothetical protein EA385_02655 [Salinarimonadaceae bacterium]|nr:MAG: hypothetical protein EA385_02655 [Salinarimonadaceae bacterium]